MAEIISKTCKPIETVTLDNCGHDALVLTEHELAAGEKLTNLSETLDREKVSVRTRHSSELWIGDIYTWRLYL